MMQKLKNRMEITPQTTRGPALKNAYHGKDMKRVWKSITENIQISCTGTFCFINGSSINHSLMIMFKIYESRKQAKLQW